MHGSGLGPRISTIRAAPMRLQHSMQNETTTTPEPLCSLKCLLQSLNFLAEVLLLPLTICTVIEAHNLWLCQANASMLKQTAHPLGSICALLLPSCCNRQSSNHPKLH